jgi:hypothetical protein
MAVLEWWLLALLAIGLSLAGWSLRNGCNVRLVATLLFLSGSALFAAAQRAEMLIYLGLAAGGFIVAMLWDGPSPRRVSER